MCRCRGFGRAGRCRSTRPLPASKCHLDLQTYLPQRKSLQQRKAKDDKGKDNEGTVRSTTAVHRLGRCIAAPAPLCRLMPPSRLAISSQASLACDLLPVWPPAAADGRAITSDVGRRVCAGCSSAAQRRFRVSRGSGSPGVVADSTKVGMIEVHTLVRCTLSQV